MIKCCRLWKSERAKTTENQVCGSAPENLEDFALAYCRSRNFAKITGNRIWDSNFSEDSSIFWWNHNFARIAQRLQWDSKHIARLAIIYVKCLWIQEGRVFERQSWAHPYFKSLIANYWSSNSVSKLAIY